MRFGALINPGAGGGAGDRRELEARLAELVEPGSLCWLDAGAVERQARRLLEQGLDGLIVGGGDGTVGAVAGVAAEAGVCLGILPLGTRNHFARDLGIPRELDAALAVIRGQRRRRVDLGELNGASFINNVSLGLYPELVRQRERYRRHRGWRKLPAQLLAAWRVLVRLPLSRISLELDGRRVSRITPVLLVANNRYADGLLADPRRPALDRGRLWVCLARAHGKLALLRACRDFVVGRTEALSGLDTAEAADLTLRPRSRRIRVAVDGELRRLTPPLRLRSRPGALEVLVP